MGAEDMARSWGCVRYTHSSEAVQGKGQLCKSRALGLSPDRENGISSVHSFHCQPPFNTGQLTSRELKKP